MTPLGTLFTTLLEESPLLVGGWWLTPWPAAGHHRDKPRMSNEHKNRKHISLLRIERIGAVAPEHHSWII
jgi:hypothetical protein